MILFITRKYPPSIGGMQKWSYELANRMAKVTPICTIAWGRSQWFLPFFIAYAFFRAISALLSRRVQVIHIGDALLSPLGVVLRCLFPVPVAVTAHGLDVVFPNRLYQWLISRSLSRVDLVVCVSEHTRKQCLERGILANKCKVILHGVDVEEVASASKCSSSDLDSIVGKNLMGNQIILSVGRLVERKGILDFITFVLPYLVKRCPEIHYLVVGEGPQADAIKRRLRELRLEKFVSLLGQVDDRTLRKVYQASDLVVMPNIAVEGDVEGFGVVALEASAAGLWVVASRLDGIPDAIREGENGFLIEPGDTEAYVEVISSLLTDEENRARLGKRAREYARRTYSWDEVIAQYRHEFDQLISGHRNETEEPIYGEAKR